MAVAVPRDAALATLSRLAARISLHIDEVRANAACARDALSARATSLIDTTRDSAEMAAALAAHTAALFDEINVVEVSKVALLEAEAVTADSLLEHLMVGGDTCCPCSRGGVDRIDVTNCVVARKVLTLAEWPREPSAIFLSEMDSGGVLVAPRAPAVDDVEIENLPRRLVPGSDSLHFQIALRASPEPLPSAVEAVRLESLGCLLRVIATHDSASREQTRLATPDSTTTAATTTHFESVAFTFCLSALPVTIVQDLSSRCVQVSVSVPRRSNGVCVHGAWLDGVPIAVSSSLSSSWPVVIPLGIGGLRAPLSLRSGPTTTARLIGPCVTDRGELLVPAPASGLILVWASDGKILPPLCGVTGMPCAVAVDSLSHAVIVADGSDLASLSSAGRRRELESDRRLLAFSAPVSSSLRRLWAAGVGASSAGLVAVGVLARRRVVLTAAFRSNSVRAYDADSGERLSASSLQSPHAIACWDGSGSEDEEMVFVACATGGGAGSAHGVVACVWTDGPPRLVQIGQLAAAGVTLGRRALAVVPATCRGGCAHLVVSSAPSDTGGLGSVLAIFELSARRRTGVPMATTRSTSGSTWAADLTALRCVHTQVIPGVECAGLAADPSGEALVVCDSAGGGGIIVLPWPLPGMTDGPPALTTTLT